MHPTPTDGDGLPAATGHEAAALAELDDLLAEMSGGPVESPQDVDARVRALAHAIADGATTDRGSAPQGQAPPPVFPHGIDPDGVLFAAFGPARVTAAIGDSLDAAIVQHAVRRVGPGLDVTHLAETVGTIRRLYDEAVAGRPTPAGEPRDSIVRDLLADRPALTRLRQLVDQPDLDVPLPQAGAVMRLLDAYPRFWATLVPNVGGFRFESRTADGRGGGLFDLDHDRVIYLSKLPATPPGAYVRLLVHELGHATFETILLDRAPMPHQLDQAVDPVGTHDTGHGREVTRLQAYWDAMSDPAKTFYHAWLTLRADTGRRLLGLDLWQDPHGNRLSPAQRRAYQAKNFGEFCAESFMLYAMGDLRPHVESALSDGTAAADVKTAWRNAWHVLDTVGASILGDRAG